MDESEESRLAQMRLFRSVTTLGFLVLAFLVVYLGLVLFGDSRRARPNVIFLAVDTLRADHLGCYGSTLGASPRIDELASRSTRFTRTLSPSNMTSSSFASFLTGTYQKTHGIVQLSNTGYRLDSGLKTLAEYLKEEGYATLGAVSAFHLDGELSGFGQGFDQYLDYDGKDPKQRAAVTTDRVLDMLDQWRRGPDGKKPLFLFVHYFDPHWPYTPPPPFDTRYWTGERPPNELVLSTSVEDEPQQRNWKEFFVSQYAGEVAYCDRELGRLLDGLDARGLSDHSLVLFTADHGENLGEHDLYFNHSRMYREVTNVPLLIRTPDSSQGRVVDALAQGLDIMPTALDFAGASVSPRESLIEGKSLRPLLEGRRKFVHREIYSEAAGEKEAVVQNRTHKLGYQLLPFLREEESYELYDVAADPAEAHDLASKRSEVLDLLKDRVRGFVGTKDIHVRFGPGGERRRYRGSFRAIKSSIRSAAALDSEPGETARRSGAAAVDFECEAGAADADEVSITVDRAATLAITLSADGRAMGNDDVTIDGRLLGRSGALYVVDWAGVDGDGLASPMAPSEPAAVLEREPTDGAGMHQFRLVVGRASGTEKVCARVFGSRELLDVRIEGGPGRIVKLRGENRCLLDSPPPSAVFRFGTDPSTSMLFVDPRIGDHKVAPKDFWVKFPVRVGNPAVSVPVAYSARFTSPDFTATAESAVEAPVAIFRKATARSSRGIIPAEWLGAEMRERLKALGYLQEGSEETVPDEPATDPNSAGRRDPNGENDGN